MTKKKSKDDDSKLSFKEQIFGKQPEIKDDKDIRRINVMTRLRVDIVDILDALVELGVFKSRSEAVAVYLESQILSDLKLYEKLKASARKIGQMRESEIELAIEDLKES
jgi:Arc/MetJ-type ribon-helix-helix transcriptional regulator